MGTVKYTGPVASFHCPTNAEIRSLKVHFSPKQEGSGDPSPENVREIVGWDGVEVSQHGRNLYSKDNVISHTADDEWNCIMAGVKQKIAVNSWPRWTFIAPAIPNATYYWKTQCYDVGFLDKDTNILTYKTGWSNTSAKAPANAAFVYHTWIKNESMSQEQLDAAFATYDLYCDIQPTTFETQNSNKTNYTFGVLGKNKLPIDTTTFTRYKQYNLENHLQPGVYTVSALINSNDTDESQSLILFEKAGENDANVQVQLPRDVRTSKTLTLVNSCAKVYIYAAKSYASSADDEATWTDVQLELGSTATTYEPYNPNHTVYGGWVDIVTGEVAEEWPYSTTFDGTEDTSSGSYTKYATYLPTNGDRFGAGRRFGKVASDSLTTVYCDSLPISYDHTLEPPYLWVAENGNYIYYIVIVGKVSEHTEITSSSDALAYTRTWLTTHNVTVRFKFTPITYSLAPTELQTFLGRNNVWSNADYVEVEYDLHETQDILARKNFIMASQPHVEEASGAIATFNTDMAAKLKECKVGFKPIQEGEGNPSADNVRPISGWTGLTTYYSGENLYVPNPDNKGYINVSGVINVDTTSTYTDLIPVTAGETYSFKCTTVYVPEGTTNRRLHGYDSNGNWVMQITNKTTAAATVEDISIVATIPSNVSYIRVSFRNQDANVRVAKEGVIGVNWSTEAGTIYGGYVDLITGEVWKTYHQINITELGNYRTLGINKNNNTQISWFLSNHLNAPEATGYVAYSRDGYCSCAPFYVNNYYWDSKCQVNNSTADLVIEGELTEEEVDNWIKARAPIQIVYPLKTSELVGTIDPQTLKSLRGINNIWSNSNGDIQVKFWKH